MEPQRYKVYCGLVAIDPESDWHEIDNDNDCIDEFGTIHLRRKDIPVQVHILYGTRRIDAIRLLEKIVAILRQQVDSRIRDRCESD